MSSRRGPWPAGACGVGLPFESFLAPQAAFGCHRPWGVGGLGTVSRHPAGARGGGGGGVAPSGPPSFAVPPLAVVFAGARPARPSAPAFPLRCLSRRVPAARARFPPPRGSRPVGTGGSRPRPSPRARPRPGDACPGGDPRDAAASARRCALSPRAAAVPRFAPRSSRREGGGGGGSVVRGGGGRGRAVRPSPVRASAPVRAPTRPLPNPGRLSAGLRPVRPVTAGSCSPSRPASVSPSLSAARGRRRPRPRRRRLLLPEGRRVVGGGR